MSGARRVVVTGHRNGDVWRYSGRAWHHIGKVRKEQLGPCCWKAWPMTDPPEAAWPLYQEATNREAAIRRLLAALGIDRAEYTTDPTVTLPTLPTDTTTTSEEAP